MSATGRGSERNEKDYYRTPDWIIKNFAEWANKHLSAVSWWDKHDVRCFDPCAGGDPENPVMPYPEYFDVAYRQFFLTNDIRADSSAGLKGDFLGSHFDKYKERFDIVISNPPYNQAQEFIERGLEMVKEDGYVIYLLRLNFFGAQKRLEFFQKHMPVYTVVSSKRPKFVEGKQTDATEYCHMIWQKGNYPKHSKLYVI